MPASCRASSIRAGRWDGTCRSSARPRSAPARPRRCWKSRNTGPRSIRTISARSATPPAASLPDRTSAFVDRLKSAKIDMGDTLLWWIALGYDTPHMIAEAMKNVGTEPEQDRRLSQQAQGISRRLRRHLLHARQARRLSGQPGRDGRGQFAQGRRVQPGSRLRRLSRWSQSIVSTGLAIGCIYALIAITYNVMFSASRVFSFTAGTLGMLGGVLGSLFILRMGMPMAGRLSACTGRRRAARHRHRDRRGAAGAQEPGPASLRALHAGAGADGPAVHRDRMEHRAAAVSAAVRHRARRLRSAVLAADAGLRGRRSSASNCSIAAP